MITEELKIPEVGEYVRNMGRLIKIEDIVPPPPPIDKDYIFEDIEAKCELIYKGTFIKSLGIFNDFYGIGTSVETAIKEMKEYATEMEITEESDLEVRITKVVSQVRMQSVDRENIYKKGYKDFETKKWGSKQNLPEPIETIVWISKTGEAKE